MTEIEISLLQEIYDASDFHQEEEVNLLNVCYATPLEVKETLEELQAQNMVSKNPVDNRYRVTITGRIALKEIQDRAEQKPNTTSQQETEDPTKKLSHPLGFMRKIGKFLGHLFNGISKLLDLAIKFVDLIGKFFVLFLVIALIVIFH